ncbi:uncharacterized protein BDV14DRAFT_196145 [Aspergillus stella-maris]|uniref:uncharacterized protein n=1 Tax=Aspergillus stella-maris TaxID=1810926 RepID=UPI003CCCB70D
MTTETYYPDMIKTTYGIAMPIYLKNIHALNASAGLGYTAEALRHLNCTRYEIIIGHTGEGAGKGLICADKWCVLVILYRPSNARETWHKDKIDELKERLDRIFETESGMPGFEAGHFRSAPGIGSGSGFVSGASSPVGKVFTRFHPKRLVDDYHSKQNTAGLEKLPWTYASKLVVYNDIPLLLLLASIVQDEDIAASRELFRCLATRDHTEIGYCMKRLKKIQTWDSIYERLGHVVPTFASGALNAIGVLNAKVDTMITTRPRSGFSRAASRASRISSRPGSSLSQRRGQTPALEEEAETEAEAGLEGPTLVNRVNSSTSTSQRKVKYALEHPQRRTQTSTLEEDAETGLEGPTLVDRGISPTSHPQRKVTYALDPPQPEPSPIPSIIPERRAESRASQRRMSKFALDPPEPEPEHSSIPAERHVVSPVSQTHPRSRSQRCVSYAEPEPEPEFEPEPEPTHLEPTADPDSFYRSYQVESALSQRRFSHVQVNSQSPPATSHSQAHSQHRQRRPSAASLLSTLSSFDLDDFPLEHDEPQPEPEPLGILRSRRLSTTSASASPSDRRQSRQSSRSDAWNGNANVQVTSQPRQVQSQSQSRSQSRSHSVSRPGSSHSVSQDVKRERRKSTITINIRMNK